MGKIKKNRKVAKVDKLEKVEKRKVVFTSFYHFYQFLEILIFLNVQEHLNGIASRAASCARGTHQRGMNIVKKSMLQRFQITDYRLPILDYRLPISDYRFQFSHGWFSKVLVS